MIRHICLGFCIALINRSRGKFLETSLAVTLPYQWCRSTSFLLKIISNVSIKRTNITNLWAQIISLLERKMNEINSWHWYIIKYENLARRSFWELLWTSWFLIIWMKQSYIFRCDRGNFPEAVQGSIHKLVGQIFVGKLK